MGDFNRQQSHHPAILLSVKFVAITTMPVDAEEQGVCGQRVFMNTKNFVLRLHGAYHK